MAVEACRTIVGMGRVVDVWAAEVAEIIAVGPVELWVVVATSGRDARWVCNIAASCGFLLPDGRPRSRQSAIIDNFRAIFRSIECNLLVGDNIVVERPKREHLGLSQQ